jgi:carboxymethylenebutenolidase
MTIHLSTPDGPVNLPLTRRSFGLATLFAGYAAAIQPANAQAITTDAEGLTVGTVSVRSPDGFQLPVYVARPAGTGRHPVVLVSSEIFGLHAYITDVCRRLAKAGYVAIAPAYFVRVADPAPLTEFPAILQIVSQATNRQVMADTDAVMAWARRQRFVKSNAAAITGFCWGGAVTWMAAAHSGQFNAGVAWYGRLVRPANSTESRFWPADVAGLLKSPVLGLYADNDSGIPLADVETMRRALAAAGNTRSRIEVFTGTQHGFHADYRPSYNAEAAQTGWTQMLEWFRTNGV